MLNIYERSQPMSLSHLIEPSINGEYLEKLLDYLETRGLSASSLLLKESGLNVNKKHPWVKARQLNWLFRHASEVLLDPYLGLRFGKQFMFNSFQIVGFLAISAPNLIEAIRCVAFFQGLYSRIGKMVLREDGPFIYVCWDATWPRALMSHHSIEASIAGWYQVGLGMVCGSFKAVSINFQHANCGDISVYQNAFDCPVLFEQKYDAICLQRHNMVEKVLLSDEYVHKALLEKTMSSLVSHGQEPLVDKVEGVLKQCGKGRIMSLEQVASELSIKPSELRGQLKKSGLSYRILLDRTKLIECLPYLIEKQWEIVDIAHELGFSEQSAFTRAFKRWTDLSPLAYKKQLLDFS